PVAAKRRYSRSGILVSLRAGVKSPPPPAPVPVPLPPAPVPVPDVPAPDAVALPLPATFAAGSGDGAGMRCGGATIGDGSAFLAGAPAGFSWAAARAFGGGWTGGGGGGCRRLKVFNCSTARLTLRTSRPERVEKA